MNNAFLHSLTISSQFGYLMWSPFAIGSLIVYQLSIGVAITFPAFRGMRRSLVGFRFLGELSCVFEHVI